MKDKLTHPFSSKKHSPPQTVPKAPSPSFLLITTLSLAISQSSRANTDIGVSRPSALILSSVAFIFNSYLGTVDIGIILPL